MRIMYMLFVVSCISLGLAWGTLAMIPLSAMTGFLLYSIGKFHMITNRQKKSAQEGVAALLRARATQPEINNIAPVKSRDDLKAEATKLLTEINKINPKDVVCMMGIVVHREPHLDKGEERLVREMRFTLGSNNETSQMLVEILEGLKDKGLGIIEIQEADPPRNLH